MVDLAGIAQRHLSQENQKLRQEVQALVHREQHLRELISAASTPAPPAQVADAMAPDTDPQQERLANFMRLKQLLPPRIVSAVMGDVDEAAGDLATTAPATEGTDSAQGGEPAEEAILAQLDEDLAEIPPDMQQAALREHIVCLMHQIEEQESEIFLLRCDLQQPLPQAQPSGPTQAQPSSGAEEAPPAWAQALLAGMQSLSQQVQAQGEAIQRLAAQQGATPAPAAPGDTSQAAQTLGTSMTTPQQPDAPKTSADAGQLSTLQHTANHGMRKLKEGLGRIGADVRTIKGRLTAPYHAHSIVQPHAPVPVPVPAALPPGRNSPPPGMAQGGRVSPASVGPPPPPQPASLDRQALHGILRRVVSATSRVQDKHRSGELPSPAHPRSAGSTSATHGTSRGTPTAQGRADAGAHPSPIERQGRFVDRVAVAAAATRATDAPPSTSADYEAGLREKATRGAKAAGLRRRRRGPQTSTDRSESKAGSL